MDVLAFEGQFKSKGKIYNWIPRWKLKYCLFKELIQDEMILKMINIDNNFNK